MCQDIYHTDENQEVNPDQKVETGKDLNDQGQGTEVKEGQGTETEGQGHGIEDLDPGTESVLNPEIGKRENDQDHLTENGLDPGRGEGKTKGQDQETEATETEGLSLSPKVVTVSHQRESMGREPSE